MNWHCGCNRFPTEFPIPDNIDTMVRVAIVQANKGCLTRRDDVIFIAFMAHENLRLIFKLTVGLYL